MTVHTTPLRVARSTLVFYGLPLLALGYGESMIGFYLMKFSTDVLLIAPVAMGAIFAASRVWDAVTDPIVGYLSDRTRSRLGRRRPWMLASVIPTAVLFVAIWMPPAGLTGNMLIAWEGISIILFFTAMTIFRIPHTALGAELTLDYHDRTRVFAFSRAMAGAGAVVGLSALGVMAVAKVDERMGVAAVAGSVAILGSASTLLATWRLRERPEFQGRGATSSLAAIRDVWRNPHARRLLVVGACQTTGLASVASMVPFACEYLYGDIEFMPKLLICYVVPQLCCVPLWAPLSRRFGKRRLWLAARGLQSVTVFFFAFIGLIESEWIVLALASLVGILEGASLVVDGSIRADVIDYDEYQTGQRKEGSYAAAWGLAGKGALALSVLIVGIVMSATGFEPNAVQSPTAEWGLRALFGFMPSVMVLAAWGVMWGFGLNESEHQELRAQLDARG